MIQLMTLHLVAASVTNCLPWTVAENQTFKANEQDTVPETGTQLTDNLKAGLPLAANPVSVCPAPTEHRLPWSHTPHPPSVASSTLFDPEGIYLRCAPSQALDFESAYDVYAECRLQQL